MLQVRGKDLSSRELAALARQVMAGAPASCVTVNDRLDVALAVGAAGCHLGRDDFPISEARRLAPPGFVLGGSAGSAEEARRAAMEGAHYLGIGPIRATPSKGDAGKAMGAAGFARVRAAAPGLPAVAIGGVIARDVPELVRAGAEGIAVISAVLGAPDPALAARELRDTLEQARG
jgi:thiamine-phosphate pyrophosphorylase